MKFRTWLEKLINDKRNAMIDLQKRSDASTDINEVRSIGEQLKALRDEINDAEKQLADLEEEDGDGAGDEGGEGSDGERSKGPVGELRNAGITKGMMMRNGTPAEENADPLASNEYRSAFKDYVQRGIAIPQELHERTAASSTTSDLGAAIPVTVMNEFIKKVSKVRGNIYSKVRKMNVRGGVKFPVSDLSGTFKWITETTVSEEQKAGTINSYVEFSYNIGEIRLATSLLASVVTVDAFEAELVTLMMEAFLEAMDKGIIAGTGTGQMLGITKDTRVTNVVEMTETDLQDWKAWRKNLFAKIPLKKRGLGEFLFPVSTVEGYLMTMEDQNKRPLWKDPDNAMSENGNFAGRFFGRSVDYVEPDVIADFDTAEDGDVVGIYWVPNDYALNSNMEFGMKRYFDEDRNMWVNKGLTIVDGKILDPSACYLIKKKVVEETAADDSDDSGSGSGAGTGGTPSI